MGTGEAAGNSGGLAITTPAYNPSGPNDPNMPLPSPSCASEVDDFVAHLASPKVKPARNIPKSPAHLSLDPTEECEEEEVSEATDGHVQKKRKGGLTKKFMSMSNLLSGVELDTTEHATDSMEPLQASHRPESPKALEHTVGTVKPTLRKSMSEQQLNAMMSDDEMAPEPAAEKKDEKMGDRLLVVFDMDRTMVGDLVSLSDRDNIETNIEWTWWPEGQHYGLSVEEIKPYLKRGMLRPGLLKFVEYLREIGATIVVYTHSELRWASKVTQGIEEIAGFKFIHRLFSRQDCRDGHPTFPARKSLQFITDELRSGGLEWASVDRAVMFDDDGNVLGGGDQLRLVRVPTYDYWEPCQWDEVVTPELLERNDDDCREIVRQSVIEWGVARPSYGKPEEELTEEEKDKDARWAEQLKKKQQLQLSYNKVAKLDGVWRSVKDCFKSIADLDDDNMETLPVRLRRALGNNAKPNKRF